MKYAFKSILLSLLALLLISHCENYSSGRKIKLRAPQKTSGTTPSEDSSVAILKIEPEKRRSIAVMYFENLTGDGRLDWMQRGIAEMLVTSLSQSLYLDVIGLERLYSLLRKMGHKMLKSVDNNFFFVYIRSKVRLLKAQALAQINQTEQAVQECEVVINRLRRADKNLPLVRIARKQHRKLTKQKE